MYWNKYSDVLNIVLASRLTLTWDVLKLAYICY